MEEIINRAIQASAYLIGIGIPLLIIYLVKDYVSNIASYFIIRTNSTFQLHNNFEYEGRKNCRILEFTWTKVHIEDMGTNQVIKVFNKNFVNAKIWENKARLRINKNMENNA